MQLNRPFALGIDLGGSNLRLGIVDRQGELLEFASQPVDAHQDGDRTVAQIVNLAGQFSQLSQAGWVGVALAGTVLPGGMTTKELSNLPGLDRYPLVERLSRAFDRPCCMENDALLALLGESRFGAGLGSTEILLLTLGTAIGGGLMLAGQLRRGAHGMGSEIGMLPFPAPDLHNLVPFEQLASPKAIMASLGDSQGRLYDRVLSGDIQAKRALEAMYRYLGWLITDLHLACDLELVILSGGLSEAGEKLVEGVRSAFHQICPTGLQFGLRIELGALPLQAAGVIGAACLCFEQDPD